MRACKRRPRIYPTEQLSRQVHDGEGSQPAARQRRAARTCSTLCRAAPAAHPLSSGCSRWQQPTPSRTTHPRPAGSRCTCRSTSHSAAAPPKLAPVAEHSTAAAAVGGGQAVQLGQAPGHSAALSTASDRIPDRRRPLTSAALAAPSRTSSDSALAPLTPFPENCRRLKLPRPRVASTRMPSRTGRVPRAFDLAPIARAGDFRGLMATLGIAEATWEIAQVGTGTSLDAHLRTALARMPRRDGHGCLYRRWVQGFGRHSWLQKAPDPNPFKARCDQRQVCSFIMQSQLHAAEASEEH